MIIKNHPSPVIGVIGGNSCTEDAARQAEDVGKEIAGRGGILICGGLGGVMEAACRGAKKKKGLTIGVLPGSRIGDANPYVDIPIVTGMGVARNIIIIRSAIGIIAVDGKYGTLSEIAFCLQFKKPIVGLGTWDIDTSIRQAAKAKEAVKWLFEMINST